MKGTILISLLLVVVQSACAQKKPIVSKVPAVQEYMGVWYAVEEGTLPDKQKKEEESKLVIFEDPAKRIIVFLATRYADRQIRFHYGFSIFDSGVLHFVDQYGWRYLISFGESADYGNFIGVQGDNFPGDEGYLGSFIKLKLK